MYVTAINLYFNVKQAFFPYINPFMEPTGIVYEH